MTSLVYAAFDLKGLNARAAALSNSGSARSLGISSLYSNPAGLNTLSQVEYSSFYTQIFSMKELTAFGSAFGIPAGKIGKIGITYHRFGSEIYSEQEFGLAHSFSPVSTLHAGYHLKGMGLNIQNFGNTLNFAADAGLTIEINKILSFGASLRNLNQPKIAGGEILRREFKIGMAVKPASGLWWMLDFEESASRWFSFSTGTEFALSPRFSIRGGFRKFPANFSGGFGIYFQRAQLDYAYRFHDQLAPTHQFNVTFRFGRCAE